MSEKTNRGGVRVGGVFEAECLDRHGRLKWTAQAKNLVVDEGLNKLLDSMFHSDPSDPWYVGLKGTGSPAAGDTLASHAGWSEITDYADDRKEYVEAAASGKSITNSANKASFSINGTVTVYGAFLCDVASGTSGKLFSAGDFSSSKSCESGDTLNVTYTLPAADDGV